MSNWKDCVLADLGEIVGGATPSTKNESYYGGDIAWITPKDLSTFQGRFIRRGERNITSDGFNSCSARLMPPHSILFTSRAPIGYVAIAENKVCTNQGFKSIVPNADTDYLFLYYLLVHNRDRIENMGSGTTFKEVSGSVMKGITVSVPTDIEEQKAIARVLGSLDDKIENNTAINNHLEQIAQAIFREQCSEGITAVLSDVMNVCYGKDHKRLGDGKVPCYGSGGIMRYVDEALYSGESVLIPRKGSLNNVLYINEPFWTVDTMFYTHMTHPNVAKFVYFTMRSLDLAGMNVGSAVPSMTTTVLNALEIVLPSDDNLASFDEIVSPMFLQMQANSIESSRLAAIRDALLPRLMSGELSVADMGAK